MPRLVFDYDSIAYQVGFASEDRYILVTHKNTKESWRFSNRTEFYGRNRQGGWLAEANISRDSKWTSEDFEIVDVQEPKPIKTVKEILNLKVRGVAKHLNAKDWYGWVGNGKGFRYDLATVSEYKGGNRKDALKPILLPEVFQILLDSYNGKLSTDNLEADDWLCIDSYEAWKDWSKTKSDRHRLIAITEDKDHLQCTGHFFNPDKMVLPETVQGFGKLFWRDDTVSPTISGRGRLWLYSMWVCGDKVDNIKPSFLANKRFADKSSYELLSGCRNDEEAIRAVVSLYKEWYPVPVTYTSWRGEVMTKSWLDIAQEMFDLVRMKRFPEDSVRVEDIMGRYGID